MRGMATLPQGNQELLVVRESWKTRSELGISKSMECDIFPSVLWHCWLCDRKGIRPVKKLDVGLLVAMIWLELCTTYSSSSPVVTTTSIILCFNKHQLTLVHLVNGHKNGERVSGLYCYIPINTHLYWHMVLLVCINWYLNLKLNTTCSIEYNAKLTRWSVLKVCCSNCIAVCTPKVKKWACQYILLLSPVFFVNLAIGCSLQNSVDIRLDFEKFREAIVAVVAEEYTLWWMEDSQLYGESRM